jgi:hypothetical protein
MGKDRSFASKVAKSQHLTTRHCPKCGEEVSYVKVVETIKTAESWRFKDRLQLICKCNEKEIMH